MTNDGLTSGSSTRLTMTTNAYGSPKRKDTNGFRFNYASTSSTYDNSTLGCVVFR